MCSNKKKHTCDCVLKCLVRCSYKNRKFKGFLKKTLVPHFSPVSRGEVVEDELQTSLISLSGYSGHTLCSMSELQLHASRL